MRTGWLITGGIMTAAAGLSAIFAGRRAEATKRRVANALDGKDAAGVSTAPNLPTVDVRLTHYWPFTATEAEKKMEGAPVDRKKQPLHTVEDFFAGKSDHVSLAGDYEAWPYKQKLLIPWGDRQIVGRVSDTGGHFHGAGKLVRALGYEPIDVCVYSRDNAPPKSKVTAQVVPGDHFDAKGKMVAYDKMGKPPTEIGSGLDLLGAEEVEIEEPHSNGVDRLSHPEDPEWRAFATEFAHDSGEAGRWEHRHGAWVWCDDRGEERLMPLSLARAMYPGVAPLFDFGDDEIV